MESFLRSLDDLWGRGALRDLERDLDAYVHGHLGELRRAIREERSAALDVVRHRHLRGEITDRQRVDISVRQVLSRRGTCNPKRDIEEQKAEIEREVWCEGERRRGLVPPERREEIARGWAADHASTWREWRTYQLLYVWDKKADHYIPLIAQPQACPP